VQRRVDLIKFNLSLLERDFDLEEFLDNFEHLPKPADPPFYLLTNDPEVVAAYWYLRGAQEALDLTMSEMFDELGTKL
jgi:hypothetical protein